MTTIDSISELVAKHQPALLPETPQTAAVMVLLLTHDQPDEIDIVLTERASTLPTYAGHMSFPGGMREPADTNLYAAATREVWEELELQPESYQYIGQLDDFHDRYGHLVRPFVAKMSKEDFIKLHKHSRAEVAGIYYLPLNKLHQLKDDPSLHAITRRRPSYSYTDGKVFVWGLTASILVHFLTILDSKKSL